MRQPPHQWEIWSHFWGLDLPPFSLAGHKMRCMLQSLGGCLKSFSFVFKSSPNSAAQGPLEQHRGEGGDHLPFSAAIGKVTELPWDLGTTWKIPNPIKAHLQKQDLYQNAKPPVRKFGSCRSTTFPTWRAILPAGSLTQRISFKLCKGILAASLAGRSPGKYICIWLLAPKAAALPSSGAPGMFFSILCPFFSCQQKALP